MNPELQTPPLRFRSRVVVRHLVEVIALGCIPLVLAAVTWALGEWQGVSSPWFSLLALLVALTAIAGAIGYIIIAVRVWHSSLLDPGERLAIWASEYFFIAGYAALSILRGF